MFDWKIIAAVFIALIIVSYLIIGVPGIREFFGGVAEGIGKALEGSPFGSLFSSSGAKKTFAEVTIHPSSFSLRPELPVNMSMGDTNLQGFKGEIAVDLANDAVSIMPEGSSLVIKPKLETITIEGLKISRLDLNEIDAEVRAGDMDTQITNGTLEVLDFLGQGVVTTEGITLVGNVTRIRGEGWEIS